jgi:TonB family protein
MREERVKAEGTGHCIHEKSATQWGGMTTPEFGIILSSIGDYKAAASTTTGAHADGALTAASPASPFKPVKGPKVAAQPQAPNQPDQKADAELARRNAKQTPDQVGAWKSAIVTKLAEHKQFPVGAPADGGKAQVRFKLDREGKVISSHIANSSGSDVLDQEALDMVQRASPLPAPPDSLEGPVVELSVPVRFSKR